MSRIKFHGFPNDSAVTLSALQNGIATAPLEISAWVNPTSGAPTTVSLEINGQTVTDGTSLTLQGVSPFGIHGRVVSIDGFSRPIEECYIEWDFGQRYTPREINNLSEIPSFVRMDREDLGRVVGPVAGHAAIGQTYDASATDRLTATCFVTDGLVSQTVTFTIEVFEPIAYYTDTALVNFPSCNGETSRNGVVVVSKTGDFSNAPTGVHIYHMPLPDGIFSINTFVGDRTDVGGPNFPWPWFNIGSILILFEEGQRFYLNGANALNFKHNCMGVSSWPINTETPAILDGATHIPDPRSIASCVTSTEYGTLGTRIWNIDLHGMQDGRQYNAATESQDWWGELRYSAKTGSFTENTARAAYQNNEAEVNGELLIGSVSGATCRLIGDDGTDTLWVTDFFGTFSDGETLTGALSGATATYVAAGSIHRDRQSVPAVGIANIAATQATIYRVRIYDTNTGISGLSSGSVFADVGVYRFFNYGISAFSAGARHAALIGVVVAQEEGSPPIRDTGGAVIMPNRVHWNTVIDNERSRPTANNIVHCPVRIARLGSICVSQCYFYQGGGGHNAHQPLMRFGTAGADTEGQVRVNITRSALRGGFIIVNFNTNAGQQTMPRTPEYIIIDSSTLLPESITTGDLVSSSYSGMRVRNNLFHVRHGLSVPLDDTMVVIGNGGRWPWTPQEYDETPRPNVIEHNTFVMEGTSGTTNFSARQTQQADRPSEVIWRNNAFVFAPGAFASVDPSISYEPLTEFTSEFRPQISSISYGTAEDPVALRDGDGVARIAGNASKGAFEP